MAYTRTSQHVLDKAEMLFPVDSQMRWFNYVASPVVDAHGEVESVVVSWKDITERKQVEEVIYRLASIVESSSDAILSKIIAIPQHLVLRVEVDEGIDFLECSAQHPAALTGIAARSISSQ
jgi:hypothetical protein